MDRPRSLAAWLRARSDAELGALLAARPDLANPVPPDLAVLAARATTRTSVLRALERLDRRRLATVEALALLEEPTTYDELLAFAGAELGGPAELAGSIDALRELALVWGDDELHVVRVVRDVLPMPAGLGPPAGAAIARYGPALLRPVLESMGLPQAPDAVSAATRVAEVLAHPARVRRLVDGLPEAERDLLDQLAWTTVGAVRDAFRPPTAAEGGPAWRALLGRGLLVAVDPERVAVPREVGLVLRDGQVFPPGYADPPAVQVTRRDREQVDRTAGGQGFTAVRALGDLLDGWGVDPPPVLRAGGLGVRDLRRTARDHDLPEPTAALYLEIAHAAGLLARSPELDAVWLPTPAYDAWRREPAADRWAALAEAWLTMSRAPGLVGTRDERAKTRAALAPEVERGSMPALRLALLRALGDLPEGAAPTADDVVELLGWLLPRRPGLGPDGLAFTVLTEAEVLGVTGSGALSGPGRLVAAGDFAGAAAAMAALLPEPVDHVLVQADLTAVAPGPLVDDLAHELHLAADVESKGGATVYRFTETSIRRALDAGRSAAELHALLDRHSRTPVPQPLHYLIDDVARRHGRIRVGAAQSFVRSDDPALLQEVLAARRTEPLRLRLLAPTVLAARAPVDRVLEVLRSAGHAPVAESPDGEVVVRRPDSRRTPPRPRPARLGEPAGLRPELVDVAVRALRAGDRAAREMPELSRPASAADTMAVLQHAAGDGLAVWIGYLNAEGEASSRLIEPRWVGGGEVRAFDHRSGELRTFLVHRVTGVAPADAVGPRG